MNIKRKNTFFSTLFIAIFLLAGMFFVEEASAALKNNGEYCGISAQCKSGYCPEINGSTLCSGTKKVGDACTIIKQNNAEDCEIGLYCHGDKSTCEADNRVASPSETSTISSKSSNIAVTGNSTTFTNPLRFKNVEEFLGGILSAIQKIIVVLALVFIMVGAVMILTSAGNSGMVEKGKGAITMALIGLAFGVAAPSLLKELSNIVGWGEGSEIAALTLSEIAVRVLNFLLGTMGIVALIMLVIGGIMYLTSAGDEDRIDKGKEIFKYSLIGILVAMSAMVLVTQVARFFQ